MIRGLHVEHRAAEGYEMILYKPNGIRKEDLDRISVQMLEHAAIPSVLAFEAEVRDFTYRFRYFIDRKRSIGQFLKGQKLKQHEYFTLLQRIFLTLEHRFEYMLQESGFVLDEEFIYIGQDVGDVYLLYLPLKGDQDLPALTEQVKSLALKWMRHIEDFDGNLIQEFFHLLEQVDSQHKLIVPFLTRAMTQTDLKGHEQLPNVATAEPLAQHSLSVVEQPDDGSEQPTGTKTEEETAQERPTLKPFTSRQRTYLYLSTVAVIAIVWRIYLEFPSTLLWIGSISLSVASVAFALSFPSLRRLKMKRSLSRRVAGKEVKSPSREEQKKTVKDPGEEQTVEQTVHSVKNDQPPTVLPRTTILPANHQTELLSSLNKQVSGAKLSVLHADGSEEHQVFSLPYVLGRDPQTAGYQLQLPGISRAHAELFQREETFYVKDLGSKNGTFLNEQPLIPNREYALQANDRLKLAETELIIKF